MVTWHYGKRNCDMSDFKKAVESTLSSQDPVAKCSNLVRQFVDSLQKSQTSKSLVKKFRLRMQEKTGGKLGLQEMFLYLMGLCEKCQVKDDSVLKILLDSLYTCRGNFEFIWLLVLLDFKSWQLLIGDASLIDIIFKHQKRLQVFEYILFHATSGCLTYDFQDAQDNRFDNQPLVDLPWIPSDAAMGLCNCPLRPVYLVCLFKDAEALRLLFKYGALVSEYDLCVCCESQPIHLLEELARRFYQRIAMAYQKNYLSDIYYRELAIVECLLLFMYEIPYFCTLWFRLRSILFETASILEFSLDPLPSPPPLKDMCRRMIRNTLRKSWNLPTGIVKLELPTALHSYLEVQRFYIS